MSPAPDPLAAAAAALCMHRHRTAERRPAICRGNGCEECRATAARVARAWHGAPAGPVPGTPAETAASITREAAQIAGERCLARLDALTCTGSHEAPCPACPRRHAALLRLAARTVADAAMASRKPGQ